MRAVPNGIVSYASVISGDPPIYPDESLPIGSNYTLPPCPVEGPFGVVFRGWTVNNQSGYVPGDVITVTFRTYISPNWGSPASSQPENTAPSTGTVYYTNFLFGQTPYPSFTAPVGSTFTLSSAPPSALGMSFLYWKIDGRQYMPGDTVTVRESTFVEAMWEMSAVQTPSENSTYTIYFSSGWSPEYGQPSPGFMENIILDAGSVYVLPECGFRTPNGYRFIGWRISGQFYSPGESIILNQNISATATWEKTSVPWLDAETFPVRISVGLGEGSTYPSGEVHVTQGESLSIDLTPAPGYELVAIQLNGRMIEPVSPLVLHTVSVPYTVAAIFQPTANGITPPLPPPSYPAPTPVYPSTPPTEPEISENTTTFEENTPADLPQAAPPLYADVPDSVWYASDVRFVTEKNLMNGVGNGLFAPDQIMNRAMLVTILWRIEGEPGASPDTPFRDVEPGTWYTDAVHWASAHGIVNGYGDGCFGPNDPLTREQTLAILQRYARLKYGPSGSLMPLTRKLKYSPWAEESVFWGENYGLFEEFGIDITDQTAEISRAEAAAYLHRFCRNLIP